MSNKTGENNPFYGKQHTEETRRQISEKLKGHYKTHDNPRKGAKCSEETRRKMSEAAKNRSEESNRKMAESLKEYYANNPHPFEGRQHSEETKKKISESVKKYAKEHPPSEETRRKLSAARKGAHNSAEHNRKISEAHKGMTYSEEYKRNMSRISAARDMSGYQKYGYKSGWYKGIWCDSSWELALVVYCQDHDIAIERNRVAFEYEWQGGTRNYLPDFVVEGQLVEVKGLATERDLAKWAAVPEGEKFAVVSAQEISPILDYVIERYGEDFTDMYEIEGTTT